MAPYEARFPYVKDLQGRYLLVNRRYDEFFHVDVDAMIGRTDPLSIIGHTAFCVSATTE